MQIEKRNRTRLFWLLQLVGWGVVNVTIFIFPFDFSFEYKIFSFVMASLNGILATSFFRYILLKRIENILAKQNLLKVLVGMFLVSLLYFGLNYGSETIYERVWDRTPEEIKFIKEKVNWISSVFGTFLSVFGWTSIYFSVKFLFKYNQNKLEELELNTTLREAQLNTLKGQVNPHFMFNSLNNIRGLMLEDVSKSRDMITKLSEMLQYALVKNTVDAIPLDEELEMVDNYIALSKIQMEDRLQFEKDIEKDTRHIMIPPMIIQLLVENAAKHGISNLKEGGIISLVTSKNEHELLIKVTNTGTLQISKDSTQLGLQNIRQRLRLLYGTKATFLLEEIDSKVVATIKIPII